MQHLVKKWLIPSVLLLAVAALVGCSAEAKRARHLKRAEEYFKKGEYIKAELEYVNVGRLSKTVDPKIMARLATIYYEQGRLLEGFGLLTNALALNPDDLDLKLKVANGWNVLNAYSNAYQTAVSVLSKDPRNDEAILLLAQSAQTSNLMVSARQKLADLVRGNSESWSVNIALAELAAREKKTNVVESELQKAAKLAPNEPRINQALAQWAFSQKKPQDAEKFLQIASDHARPRSTQRLLLAQYFLEKTNYPAARAVVEKQLKEAPDYIPASVLQGRIALAEKDYAGCSRICQSILSWAPLSLDMRLLLARAFVLQNEPAKALEEFARLEKLYPKAGEVKYEAAVALVQKGAPDEAIRKLDEVIRQYPGYRAAILLRSELQMRTGAADQAAAALAPLVKKDPNLASAEVALANAYRVSGKFDDAIAVYRRLARQFPSAPDFPYLTGTVLLQQNKRDQARVSFEEALKIAPTYFPAVEQLVYSDIERQDIPSARRRVDEQLKLSTNSPRALMLDAKLCVAQNDFAAAEAALLKVIEAAPEAPAPYSLLASVYLTRGEPQKAIAQMQTAARQNPKNPGPLVVMGTLYENVNQYDKARSAYEDALKINPRLAAALNNLAYLLSEHFDDLDAALANATKAVELAPQDQGIKDTLGWVLYRKGEFLRAVTLLRESAGSEQLQKNAEAQYHLAMASYSMDDEATARAVLARVADLDKNYAQKVGASQRIAVLDASVSAPATVAQLDSALKQDSRDVIAAMKLGQAHEHAGAYDKARAAYEQAVKVNPFIARPQLLLAGLNANHLNNLPKALEAARNARKLAPNDPAVAAMLGRISYRTGDYPTALASLQEYARSDKADADAYYDLALAFYAVGEVQLARANLDRYITAGRGTRLADARNVTVLLDFQDGKAASGQAAPIATARLQKDPNDIPALMALGLVDREAKKYAEAAQKFERIAAASKSFAPAFRQLGILYGRYLETDAKALEYGGKARQTYSGDPELSNALGRSAYRQKDFNYAAQLLNEAAKGNPTDGETQFFLGMSYSKLRRNDEAKKALTLALSAKLDPQYASEAKAALNEIKPK